MERAEQLRPNCRIETETRLQWLRETDALLRTRLVVPDVHQIQRNHNTFDFHRLGALGNHADEIGRTGH